MVKTRSMGIHICGWSFYCLVVIVCGVLSGSRSVQIFFIIVCLYMYLYIFVKSNLNIMHIGELSIILWTSQTIFFFYRILQLFKTKYYLTESYRLWCSVYTFEVVFICHTIAKTVSKTPKKVTCKLNLKRQYNFIVLIILFILHL
jgi:hypothetical protein